MPELPDVEAFRTVLESCAVGREIRGVEVRDAGVLHGVGARELTRALEGRRFEAPERRGKWLLAHTDGEPTLLLHFGMTGRLVCAGPDDAVQNHDRVLIDTVDGRQLRFRDQRKLQGLWLARDEAEIDRLLGDQGPDAARIGGDEFEALLASRRGRLKPTLTDQTVVAGLGNLLADEILWRARLRPDSRADALSHAERRRLYTRMRSTLRSAVAAGCVPSRESWLTGHRDDVEPTCPRCGNPLRRTRMAGRGTVWCPHCQANRP